MQSDKSAENSWSRLEPSLISSFFVSWGKTLSKRTHYGGAGLRESPLNKSGLQDAHWESPLTTKVGNQTTHQGKMQTDKSRGEFPEQAKTQPHQYSFVSWGKAPSEGTHYG